MTKTEEYIKDIDFKTEDHGEAGSFEVLSNIYEFTKDDIIHVIKMAQIDAIDEFITRLVEDDKAAEYFTQDDDPDYLEVMYYSSAIYDLHKQLRKEIE